VEELNRSEYPVLVVEDDAEVRCLLEREVADRGHPVISVGSAEKALEVMQDTPFAVVVTDIKMPGMDGVELTRQVKRLHPDAEVILVTGFASVDTASQALRLGAADYLTKPFGDIDRIGQSLDHALSLHCRRLATHQRIVELEAHRETLAHLLDRLPMGAVVVGGAGRVLMSNQAARQIFEGDGPGLEAALRLKPLSQLVGCATSARDGSRVGGAVIAERAPDSDLPPLSILVTPLGDVMAAVGRDQPAAAIFVSDPMSRVETAEELLGRLYALTPTEARIAAVLMQGRRVDDAASELGISTNTVRTHLRHLFGKTGTCRQGELISLLLSGPALLRMGQD